jgi:hypothetical protein
MRPQGCVASFSAYTSLEHERQSETTAMIHAEPQHLPFMLSLLPFLGAGIMLPTIAQDWCRGTMVRGDAIGAAIMTVLAVAWYFAILHSIRAERRQGKDKLLGRELTSWLWAPPLTFVVGFASGFALLN